uniref:Uncharacterized protein n=1 Tax=Oryza barthii TaxID=65489 RepID=A0A0D3H767_9ORYZ
MDLRGRDLAAELDLEFTTARSHDWGPDPPTSSRSSQHLQALERIRQRLAINMKCITKLMRIKWRLSIDHEILKPLLARAKEEVAVAWGRPDIVVFDHLETRSGAKELETAERRWPVTLGWREKEATAGAWGASRSCGPQPPGDRIWQLGARGNEETATGDRPWAVHEGGGLPELLEASGERRRWRRGCGREAAAAGGQREGGDGQVEEERREEEERRAERMEDMGRE